MGAHTWQESQAWHLFHLVAFSSSSSMQPAALTVMSIVLATKHLNNAHERITLQRAQHLCAAQCRSIATCSSTHLLATFAVQPLDSLRRTLSRSTTALGSAVEYRPLGCERDGKHRVDPIRRYHPENEMDCPAKARLRGELQVVSSATVMAHASWVAWRDVRSCTHGVCIARIRRKHKQ